MGIDYDAKLIFGTAILYFGNGTIRRLEKFDSEFHSDLGELIYKLNYYDNLEWIRCEEKEERNKEENNEEDECEPDLYKCVEIVNAWLKIHHPKLTIVVPSPYYDSPAEDRIFYLTYEIENGMNLKELQTFISTVDIEEFQKVYEILVGKNEDENKIPKLWALPNIW
ncbi:Hypothetical protein HVR_LOCUS523 [uncultured virus]|nr:Hypothetical protein HVR_LOCUS523 [uncultured virus]